MKPRKWIAFAILMVGIVVALLWPIEEKAERMSQRTEGVQPMDLSGYANTPPSVLLHLLFIHHSCGGQLLAAHGAEEGKDIAHAIYSSHPNGGGLRSRLEQNSYKIHEASYGSELGERTDVFDWLPKFRNQMDQVLACDFQDKKHLDGIRNQIVVFKSCFPNNAFTGEGAEPGNPAGPELTVRNAKASYTALLAEFRKHPEVLYVCLTAPPLAPKIPPQPLWKLIAKKVLGRYVDPAASAHWAREFSSWLAAKEGWLKDYNLPNVVVFDYFDILTGGGTSDFCAFPTGNGYDSHPSSEGNQKAADAFVPFLNRAIHRSGLIQSLPTQTKSNQIKPYQT
jgi:hypothetical protein